MRKISLVHQIITNLKYSHFHLSRHWIKAHKLTAWFIKSGGSMLHSQGLSNNPYPESIVPIHIVLPSTIVIQNYLLSHTKIYLISQISAVDLSSTYKFICDVSEHPCFYSVRFLASRQTPKLEEHSWSAVHDCLFNIFAANLHIWRPTAQSGLCLGDGSR